MRSMSKLLLSAFMVVAWHVPAVAGSHTPIGQVIENAEIPKVGGGTVKIVGNTAVNVLVFFRPGQDHSQSALRDVSAVEKDLRSRSLRWVGVVSDRHNADAIAAGTKDADIHFAVGLDADDKVYSSLGLTLMPEIALVGKDGKLTRVLPFSKVNFREALRAEVRFALKEITEAELQATVNPEALPAKAENSVAKRHVKMAEMILNAGNVAKALESAKVAVQLAPDLAAAHTVLGLCLAAGGDCKAATDAFDAALKLDKGDAKALEGKKACAAKAK
jgi:tetratricopeptide (TPR) repeat protein